MGADQSTPGASTEPSGQQTAVGYNHRSSKPTELPPTHSLNDTGTVYQYQSKLI